MSRSRVDQLTVPKTGGPQCLPGAGHPLRTLAGPGLVLVALLFQPADACAQHVHVVETRGTRIGDVGQVQEQAAPEIWQAAGTPEVPRVGYHYRYSGLYYVDFWTSDGGYCVYHGDKYWKLSPEQAADLLGIRPDQLSKPWRYRVPVGLVLVSIVIGGVVYMDCSNRLRNRRRGIRFRALVDDPRYQRAIRQLDEAAPEELAMPSRPPSCDELGSPAADPAASGNLLALRMNHAVNGLAAEGIERTLAMQNLTFLMEELADRARLQRIADNGTA